MSELWKLSRPLQVCKSPSPLQQGLIPLLLETQQTIVFKEEAIVTSKTQVSMKGGCVALATLAASCRTKEMYFSDALFGATHWACLFTPQLI
jgi:hypothetical protein